MEFSIENIARDLAFEIHLGGDRFGPEDLAEVLRGISEADLKIFRERTLLHARDFAPAESSFVSFAERMVDMWLKDIETAEKLGKPAPKKSMYKDVVLSDDKGKYFAFDDGSIRRCKETTIEAAWGAEARKHVLVEMSEKDVVLHDVDLLFSSYGHNLNGTHFVDLVTHASLPEGDVVQLYKEKGEIGFVLKDNIVHVFRVPFEEAYVSHPSIVKDIVSYELDERIYREVREKEIRRQDVADFKRKAGELIDRVGERVRMDFLYDKVEIASTEKGRVFILREVDDLSESKRFFVHTVTPNGSSVSFISESFDAGALVRLTESVDKCLAALPKQEQDPLSSGRIEFTDGPVVPVPEFATWGQLNMKVNAVYVGFDGQLMVEGIVKADRMEFPSSYYLNMLSDKSVKKIREASDKSLALFQSHMPKPEIKHGMNDWTPGKKNQVKL